MATRESPAAVSLLEAPAAAGRLPAVEVAHLRKTYGTLVAVDDVSFTVAEGEIFGILGPNGAGKTTAIECAIGLRRPDAGTIRLLGLDPHADPRQVHEFVGVQLQSGALPARLRVGEILGEYRSFYRHHADPARPARPARLLPRAGHPAPPVDHPGTPVLAARRAGRRPAVHRAGRPGHREHRERRRLRGAGPEEPRRARALVPAGHRRAVRPRAADRRAGADRE